jgi:hypothetical protein
MGLIAWLIGRLPFFAVYLFVGYTLGKIANAIYRDNRPNSELWAFPGKLLRILFFPFSYHSWNARESYYEKDSKEAPCTMRNWGNGNWKLTSDKYNEQTWREERAEEEEQYCRRMMFYWPIKSALDMLIATPQILFFSVLYFPRTVWRFFGLFGNLSGLGKLASGLTTAISSLGARTSGLGAKLKSLFNYLVFEPDKDNTLGGEIRELKKIRETGLEANKKRLADALKSSENTLKIIRDRILKAQELVASKPYDSQAARRSRKLLETFQAREQEQVSELEAISQLITELNEKESLVNDQFQVLDLYDGTETLSEDIHAQAKEAVAAARAAMKSLQELADRASEIEIKALVELDSPLFESASRTIQVLPEPEVPLQKIRY